MIRTFKALRLMGPQPPLNSQIDCLSSVTVFRLPGFIDTHVHTRDPGHEHKETWETVTRAALAGGITMILAMPNTSPPLTDAKTFDFTEKVFTYLAFFVSTIPLLSVL